MEKIFFIPFCAFSNAARSELKIISILSTAFTKARSPLHTLLFALVCQFDN